jgi:hypothetical protein
MICCSFIFEPGEYDAEFHEPGFIKQRCSLRLNDPFRMIPHGLHKIRDFGWPHRNHDSGTVVDRGFVPEDWGDFVGSLEPVVGPHSIKRTRVGVRHGFNVPCHQSAANPGI